ncbi:hypothetical protein ILUMI_11574 [Ignelater luminosus]|uniref:Pacifastin domain-containing protein n=1 Tax=Ignelater luminosus TaxID=2038154 RepID=A0A8K0CVR7_IGNLU|nr:hypothetical protein ILUMI_11574 [Ignelater luminosus]
MSLAWFRFTLLFFLSVDISHMKSFRCKNGHNYSIDCNRCWCAADDQAFCSNIRCAERRHKYLVTGQSSSPPENYRRSIKVREKPMDNVINNFFKDLEGLKHFQDQRAGTVQDQNKKSHPRMKIKSSQITQHKTVRIN